MVRDKNSYLFPENILPVPEFIISEKFLFGILETFNRTGQKKPFPK